MNTDQIAILAILCATVGLFLWGRWRHDMVAVGALLACVLTGLVAADEAFAGFGHPAVITVACVLMQVSLVAETAMDKWPGLAAHFAAMQSREIIATPYAAAEKLVRKALPTRFDLT